MCYNCKSKNEVVHLVMVKFQAPIGGTYNLITFFVSNGWMHDRCNGLIVAEITLLRNPYKIFVNDLNGHGC